MNLQEISRIFVEEQREKRIRPALEGFDFAIRLYAYGGTTELTTTSNGTCDYPPV